MKNLKIYGILVMLLLSVGFVSCSDDDKNSENTSKLIGLWDLIYDEGYEINDGYNYEWSNEVNDEYRIEFLDGGVVKEYEYYNNKWNLDDAGTYYVEGNKVYVKYSDGSIEGCTILGLTNNKLVIEYYEKDGSDEYYHKNTFRKL